MFRNKYKFAKNHGLLPSAGAKPYRSSVTTVAILGRNEESEYEMCVNPSNKKILMLFNDKEYLHRECSLILEGDSPEVRR